SAADLISIGVNIVTVNDQGEVIDSATHQAFYFEEPLAKGVPPLNLVAIPSGEFMMGSPEDEPGRYDDESPQHSVKLKPFFISQYPVTQAQWRAVSALPQQTRDLEPGPSNFKGDDRPVEQVSWYDTIEFCARLSEHTGRTYRLPTEAEWEYACRADTTTPFYFGATITTDLANYDGSVFLNEPKGTNRGETTPVGKFPPNAFGLYGMHGNVWEWCLDHWHDNYEGAPTDGSAWLTDNEEAGRVSRGGSWNNYPRNCRSACRNDFNPGVRFDFIGFRVVCEAQDF
ncbi:MAG: formylglycine-generating enzyme family protein, partial [Leptolyngbya sp. SIO4C5]|nr:formylglycine-generating enzyme family protein [Leptolyngbya sp. SIO4C5]